MCQNASRSPSKTEARPIWNGSVSRCSDPPPLSVETGLAPSRQQKMRVTAPSGADFRDWQLRPVRPKIQPPVIKRPWRIVPRPSLAQFLQERRSKFFGWKKLKMPMQHECPQVLLKFKRTLRREIRLLQVGLHILEPGRAQARRRAFSIRKKPGLGKFSQPHCECGRLRERAHACPQTRKIRPPTALRMQPARRTQRPEQIAEQRIVIPHPME